MAIDFPNSPLVNDTFSVGNQTWKWNGTTWDLVALAGPTGPTGPTGPNDHGLLTGLADDDHSQYLLANGTRSLSGDLTITTAGGTLLWTNGSGPHGLEMYTGTSSAFESALYYRTGTNAWSFEDASANIIASFDADTRDVVIGNDLDVTGYLRTGHPYFDLRRTTQLSVANATMVVHGWDSETADPAGLHASSNGYVTLNKSGIWSFQCSMMADNSSTSYQRNVILATNSNPANNTTERLATQSIGANGASYLCLHVAWTGYLASGTTVYTLAYQSSGVTVNWNVASRIDLSTFSGALICEI